MGSAALNTATAGTTTAGAIALSNARTAGTIYLFKDGYNDSDFSRQFKYEQHILKTNSIAS